MPTPKRDAILSAALEAFAERGVGGVAVPDIAARAGVGTGTIYRHFESKEALVNTVYREQKLAFADHLFTPYPPSADARGRFRLFWNRLDEFARHNPSAFRFLELQDHLPYLTADTRAIEHDILERLTGRVRELQEEGTFRRDIRNEVLATMIWGAFVQLHKAQRGGYMHLSGDDVESAGDAIWALCTSRMSSARKA